MSWSGNSAINSGPLVIRTYNDRSANNTYLFGQYDIPISTNYVLITSTNGILAPSDKIYVSSLAVSSLQSNVDQTSTLNSIVVSTSSIYATECSTYTASISSVVANSHLFSTLNGSTIIANNTTTGSLFTNLTVLSSITGSSINTSSLCASSINTNVLYFSTANGGDLITSSIIASSLFANNSNITSLVGSTFNISTLGASMIDAVSANVNVFLGNTMILSTMQVSSIGVGNLYPLYTLDVTGDINFTGNLYKNQSTYSVTISTFTQWSSINNNLYYNAGKVGIGITQPNYTLDVFGTTQCNSAVSGDVALIISTGKVGIGTNTPNAALQVVGTLNATSKNFDIPHPLFPSKRLVHSCIEGPRIDLLYRGMKSLVDGKASVNIDKESTSAPECAMTVGTFEALTTNPVFYLQNTTSFDRLIGTISSGTLFIECQNPNSTDTVSWMVLAERADPSVKEAAHTNADGLLITEYDSPFFES